MTNVEGIDTALTPVQVLTQARWLVGKLVAPASINLLDFLGRAPEFLTLTDVILEGRPKNIGAFVLQRSAIVFLTVETDEALISNRSSKDLVGHSVSCLLRNGTLFGKMNILRGVRLSDYLSKHVGFIQITECRYRIRDPWSNEVLEHQEPELLLNCQSVIGVSEE